MGYSYTNNGKLCCDYCGNSGAVRKRTCPHKVTSDSSRGERLTMPYCSPPAMCVSCYNQHKDTIHARCKDAARKLQADYDAIQQKLDAGDSLAVTAWGDWKDGVPEGKVLVCFSNDAYYLVPQEEYQTRRFLSDFPNAIPFDEAKSA